METTSSKILIYEKVSTFLVAALGFLMPVFFLTTTTEFFEINKLALLTLVTLGLVVLWATRILVSGNIQHIRSTLDLPLFIYTVLFLVSTVFSISKTSSVWGSQGRWFPSLFALLVIGAYYFIASSNFKTAKSIKTAVYALAAGGTFSTLVAILGYFNIFLGQETYLKNPGFTLTGSVTSTIFLAVICALIAFASVYKERFLPVKIVLITAFLVNFFYIAIVGTAFAWILLVIGAAMYLLSADLKTIARDKFVTMFLVALIASSTLLATLPATKSLLNNTNYPVEVSLSLKDSWVITAATIQNDPLIATGPSTFYLNFSRYRPLSLNATSLWDTRFDKPHDEVLNTLGTMGILGAFALLLVGIKIAQLSLVSRKSQQDETGLGTILSTVVLVSVASFLLTYATVLNTFVLFYFVTLLIAFSANVLSNRKVAEFVSFSFSTSAAVTTTIGDTSAIRKEYANVIAITPVIVGALFGVYLFGKTYLAENYMRKAILAALNNQAAQAYDYQAKAINANPQRDAYHTAYAQTNLVLANAVAANKNLTDQDKTTIQTLVSQSIRSTRVATEVINSLNVTNWQTRALIYRSLINVADNAAEWAIGAYNTAVQLDPTNPALRVDLGGVYYAQGDFLTAANLFRQAVTLKPDYANAHYNFAQALLNLKDTANAKRELETTRGLVPQGSADFQRVENEIAALDALQAQVAGAATEKKPTVEEIAGNQNQPAVPQGPLTNPAQATETPSLEEGVLPATQAPAQQEVKTGN